MDNQKYTKEDALDSLEYAFHMIQSLGNILHDLQRQLNETASLVYIAGRFIEEELEEEEEQDSETGTVCEKEV